jgi:hypothetical protein
MNERRPKRRAKDELVHLCAGPVIDAVHLGRPLLCRTLGAKVGIEVRRHTLAQKHRVHGRLGQRRVAQHKAVLVPAKGVVRLRLDAHVLHAVNDVLEELPCLHSDLFAHDEYLVRGQPLSQSAVVCQQLGGDGEVLPLGLPHVQGAAAQLRLQLLVPKAHVGIDQTAQDRQPRRRFVLLPGDVFLDFLAVPAIAFGPVRQGGGKLLCVGGVGQALWRRDYRDGGGCC